MSEPSQRLLEMISSFESFRDTAYVCPGGQLTIGFGTTVYPGTQERVKRGETCSRQQAWSWLTQVVAEIRDQVVGLISWQAPEHVVDACTSFAYNVGVAGTKEDPGFRESVALRRLNKGDVKGAAAAMAWWNKATDPKTGKQRVLGGLTARRASEADLLQNGWDGTAGGTPIGITENRPRVLASGGAWGAILAIGTTLFATGSQLLPTLLPGLIEHSQAMQATLSGAASTQDLLVQLGGVLLGCGIVLWKKRQDLGHWNPFGSQGR